MRAFAVWINEAEKLVFSRSRKDFPWKNTRRLGERYLDFFQPILLTHDAARSAAEISPPADDSATARVSPRWASRAPREGHAMLRWTVVALVALLTTAGWAHAQEVKVGVNLPYTGIGAEFAQSADRGMQQYLKLNAKVLAFNIDRRFGDALEHRAVPHAIPAPRPGETEQMHLPREAGEHLFHRLLIDRFDVRSDSACEIERSLQMRDRQLMPSEGFVGYGKADERVRHFGGATAHLGIATSHQCVAQCSDIVHVAVVENDEPGSGKRSLHNVVDLVRHAQHLLGRRPRITAVDLRQPLPCDREQVDVVCPLCERRRLFAQPQGFRLIGVRSPAMDASRPKDDGARAVRGDFVGDLLRRVEKGGSVFILVAVHEHDRSRRELFRQRRRVQRRHRMKQ